MCIFFFFGPGSFTIIFPLSLENVFPPPFFFFFLMGVSLLEGAELFLLGVCAKEGINTT